ncbi:MAG: AMP-binding protein [Pseudomonadota bacterium]|jgi:cyclohexanecarboxylate-CoA ligase
MAIQPFLTEARIRECTESGHWRNRTIVEYLDQHADLHPEQLAVVDHNSETGLRTALSYRQLRILVDRLALGFIQLGVGKGDVISCQLPNWWEFLAIHLAAVRIGAVTNPLMPIFRHREVEYMMGFAETRLAIVPRRYRGFDYPAMMDEVRGNLPALREVLVVGGPAQPDSFERELLQRRREDEFDRAAIFAERRLDPNAVVQVMYTSGTTGAPKGVMHISNTLLACLRNFADSYHLSGRDNILMGSPLAHQTGFLVGLLLPVYLGAKTVYLDIWNAAQALRLVQDEGISFTMGATPFVADLAQAAEATPQDTSTLRTFVTGGAPIPRAVAEHARQILGCQVYGVYGMTESLLATLTVPEDPPEKIYETDGAPKSGVELRLVDAQGRPVGVGEEGEVQTRGVYNCCGYLKREDLTRATIGEDGWLSSGDLARMDADGYIRITGRSKDIIIRGGENVPVVEVEELLYRHPAIQDAALVGMPDPRLGERGCLFVTLVPGAHFDLAELQRYLDQHRMARQYWPERLEIRDELPRTPSGKIQKFRLREEARIFGETGAGLNFN